MIQTQYFGPLTFGINIYFRIPVSVRVLRRFFKFNFRVKFLALFDSVRFCLKIPVCQPNLIFARNTQDANLV